MSLQQPGWYEPVEAPLKAFVGPGGLDAIGQYYGPSFTNLAKQAGKALEVTGFFMSVAFEFGTGVVTAPIGVGVPLIGHALDRGISAAVSPEGERLMGLTAAGVYQAQKAAGLGFSEADVIYADDLAADVASTVVGTGYAAYKFLRAAELEAELAAARAAAPKFDPANPAVFPTPNDLPKGTMPNLSDNGFGQPYGTPAPATPPRTGSYSSLTTELKGTGQQAHHLNQNAAYRDIIPESEGLSVGLRGNAFTEVGSPHYEAHRSLESFWNQFRPGGARFREFPTNAEYGVALEQSLRAGGYSAEEASSIAAQAARQRAAYGLADTAQVPRIPVGSTKHRRHQRRHENCYAPANDSYT